MRKKITVTVRCPWHECKDGIPESGRYIVFYPNCVSGPYVTVDIVYGDTFSLDDHNQKDSYFGKPSHWMEFPKPPEEYNG